MERPGGRCETRVGTLAGCTSPSSLDGWSSAIIWAWRRALAAAAASAHRAQTSNPAPIAARTKRRRWCSRGFSTGMAAFAGAGSSGACQVRPWGCIGHPLRRCSHRHSTPWGNSRRFTAAVPRCVRLWTVRPRTPPVPTRQARRQDTPTANPCMTQGRPHHLRTRRATLDRGSGAAAKAALFGQLLPSKGR
jgi:hypothetical protein